MNNSNLFQQTLNLGSKSLAAVVVINLLFELKSIRYDKEKKRYTIGTNQCLGERLKEMLKQFTFIFGQFFCFNWLIRLNSKRLTLPLGALIGYAFSELCGMSMPLLVSAYILAKIGAMLIERGVKLGIIKHEMLFYKVLFVVLMGVFNIYMLIYPDLMPRRVYKNYMKIGRLTDVDRMQFDLLTGREPAQRQV